MSFSKSALTLLVAGMIAGACSGNVEKAKRAYLARGDEYVKEKNLDAAIIEYRNAIQKDARFAEAYKQLAAAYLLKGDGPNGLRTALTAADLSPDDREAQIAAGDLLLMAGRFADARKRAEQVLTKDPQNLQARVLLGNAAAGLKDVDKAIKEFEEALRLDPTQPATYTSLGALKAAKGNSAEAERAFQQAISHDPKSVAARLALAQFYWFTGRLDEAERTMKETIAEVPRDERAHLAIATFYRYTSRAPRAEQHLRAAYELNHSPSLLISLADYYIIEKRVSDAVPLLQGLAGDRQFGVTAKMRLASVARMQGRFEEAMQTIEQALRADPKNSMALSLKSDFLRQDNKFDEALKVAEAAVSSDRSSVEAQLVRGRILAAEGHSQKAEEAFNEVLRLNPRASVAQVEIARLNLKSGSVEGSAAHATQALNSDPQSLDARLMLARSLIAKGELTQAQALLEVALRAAPDEAAVRAEMGSVLLLKRDTTGARLAFNRALALDPLQVEAIGGLTTLDFEADHKKDALARLDAAIKRSPKNSGLLMMAASAYGAVKDLGRAESLLITAVESDPSALPAYAMLGQIYLTQNKLESARSQFENLASHQERPVAPLTMVGMIDLAQNKPVDARKTFERVLRFDPQAAVAANNLAWIYSENGGNLDLALQLAQTAKSSMPERPEVHDTLGWIYYKKDQNALAIPALRRSLELNPKSAGAAYHLALAYEKSGDRLLARQMLEESLKLEPNAARSADIRRRLQSPGL